MSRHFGFGSLIVCLVLFTSGGAEALTLLSSTRTVLADTSYDIFPTTSDADQDGETRTDPGAWIGAGVAASGLVNIAQATAEATQDSTVTTTDPFTELLVSGGGAAGAAFDVNDPGFASRAQGFGTTSIEVVFDITTPKLVALAVSLLADLDELRIISGAGPANADVFAFFALVGANVGLVASGDVFDSEDDGIAESDDFTFGGTLAPDTYALTIGAQAEVSGFENSFGFALSSFGFEMRVVPEPRLPTLLALAAIASFGAGGGRRATPARLPRLGA